MAHLIIGAGDIGKELMKQLVVKNEGSLIIGTVRHLDSHDVTAFEDNHNVSFIELDINSDESCKMAAKRLSIITTTLDSIYICAGIANGLGDPLKFPVTDFQAVMDTNVVGCVRAVNSFIPFLLESSAGRRLLVILTSSLASMGMAKQISDMTMPRLGLDYMPAMGYTVSNTARNMLAVQYSLALRPKGIICAAMSPGWVKTRLGGPHALQTREESTRFICFDEAPEIRIKFDISESGVQGMLETLDNYTLESEDIFRGFHSASYPW